MKFSKKSIEFVRGCIDTAIRNSKQFTTLKTVISTVKFNDDVKDPYVALLFLFWNNCLTKEQRDQACTISDIPFSGGYADITDQCIETMLKRVITKQEYYGLLN